MDWVFAGTACDLTGSEFNSKAAPLRAAKATTDTIATLDHQTFDAILLKFQSCSQTRHSSSND
jgi:hypothetical protein